MENSKSHFNKKYLLEKNLKEVVKTQKVLISDLDKINSLIKNLEKWQNFKAPSYSTTICKSGSIVIDKPDWIKNFDRFPKPTIDPRLATIIVDPYKGIDSAYGFLIPQCAFTKE